MTTKANIEKEKAEEKEPTYKTEKALTCGIIMPIAAMSPEYPESHWVDVRHIIDSAIKRAGFTPRIVSESEDSTIIHKSIINNIYNDPIIVCDVSNKNANVMFELGMRLAFNKPVVIIKDDKTGYSFDTSNIQHLGYRKDLRHNTVEKFIDDLATKIKATYEAPTQDGYQSFLSHFGKFEVATIENKSIPESEALQKILDKMAVLENKVSGFSSKNSLNSSITNTLKFKLMGVPTEDGIEELMSKIQNRVPDRVLVYYSYNDNTIRLELDDNLNPIVKENIRKDIQIVIDNWDELPI